MIHNMICTAIIGNATKVLSSLICPYVSSCTLSVEVREDTGVGGSTHRVVWCPYIPDEDDAPDDDVARLLLTTHANQGIFVKNKQNPLAH